jgi:hypothetical protein
MWEPDSFNEKLVLGRARQLAFRNVFTKMEEIGLALPAISFRETNAFIRGGNSIIF